MAETTTPLCIYHGNCADGFAAAWVVRKALPNAEFVSASYGSAPPDVTGREVYIVDFSYSRDVLVEMAATAKHITVLDHHKTARAALEGLDIPNVCTVFDMQRSGCRIAWDHFFPNDNPPTLLLHVEDRDLWHFNLTGTREVLAAVFSYPYDFKTWDGLMKEDLHSSLYDDGYAIERKHNKDVESLISSARLTDIAGHHVPTVNLPPTMASDAGAALAKGHPFAAVYWDTRSGRQYSLRSAPDGIDVAAIAQQFGGGGHKHAAGFKVPFELPLASHQSAQAAACPHQVRYPHPCRECEDGTATVGDERAAVPDGMVLVTWEDGNNYCRILTLLGMEEEGDAVEAVTKLLTAAPRPPQGARVVDGWLFYFADDDGGPHAHYCGTRDEVYAHVAEWMTGDREGNALSDAGDDMIEGVTATLIESGAFHPEGDPPCFLRKIAAPTLAGKEDA